MSKIRHILFAAFFVFAVIFLSSTFARAQGAVTYRFLEVVDFSGKPVAEAKVETSGCPGEKGWTTNQKGQLEDGLPICIGDFQTRNFRISKPGFYKFEDLGLLSLPFNNSYKHGYVDKYRIELLKISQNKAERKNLGNEQLKRELFLAVKYGKTDEVERLLKTGISPNISTRDLRGIPGPKDVPAIIFAAALTDVETMKVFLDAGADIRSKNSNARNILLYYLDSNPESFGSPFLNYYEKRTEEQRADPMRFFEEGFDILIKAGADREAASEDGRLTPLKIAIWKNYVVIVKKLLAAGVSERAKSDALLDLVVTKSENDPLSLELAGLLLKAGAKPDFVAAGEEDIYDDYCQTPLMAAGNAGKFGFANFLLANKADINFACRNGKTALISALRERRPETAKFLLEAGADANGKRFSFGETALMLAAERGFTEVVEMLIAKGAAVNARNETTQAALDYAVSSNYDIDQATRVKIVDLLLKAGANPTGQTAPYCAVPLTTAAARGNVGAMRRLIDYKADVNLSCGWMHAPIVWAVRNNHTEAIKILLDAGADVKGEQGRHALKYARENLQKNDFKSKAEEIIKLLEAAGAKE